MTEAETAAQQGAVRVRSFSKVTIAGPRGQANLAVPDDMSMPELVRSAVEALGETPGTRWRIEHPSAGVLEWRDTLASVAVRDGTVLHLRTDPAATAQAMVDDVSETVAETVESRRAWNPDIARAVGAVLYSAWLAAGAIVAVTAGMPWPVPLTCYTLVVAGLAATRTAGRDRPGILLAVLGLVAAGAAGWSVARLAQAPPAVELGAAAAGVAIGCVVTRMVLPVAWAAVRPGAVGAMVVVVASAIVQAGVLLGLDDPRLWSLVLLAAVLGLSFLTPVGAALAGLGRADDHVVDGRGARRRAVEQAVASALAEMTAAGVALSVTASIAAVRLAGTGNVAAVWLAVLGLVAVFLRGRSYRHAPLALAISVPALASAGWLTLTSAGDVTAYLLMVAAGAVVLGLFALRPAGPVGASRLRMLADRVETMALVVAVPVGLAVWDLYATVAGLF